ncbi:DUF4105 domain-containing protein [Paracnuella aquatica]|nr:DUF4105 domain-containing protein [Paracnuella aquatica]
MAHLRKPLLLGCLLFLFSIIGFSQPDSCSTRISLLTCSPGNDLYSTFGHTAIRVQDPLAGTDIVYNYGTFEFSPDFYIKFIRGKLNYALATESYADFLYTYQYESRSVVEQELLLTCAQKDQLWMALQHNATPENRFYLYDFLFDNCTTRARDMIVAHAGKPVTVPNVLPGSNTTFRNMLHTYLDRGGQHWSKLGIDILLGSRIDRKVEQAEATFLPDFLLKAMNGATGGGSRIATDPQPLLTMPSTLDKGTLFLPSVVFGAMLLLALVLSFYKRGAAQKALRIFDRSLFLLLGLAGVLLVFMWVGTDHRDTKDNFNLLWALPTHLLGAYLLGRGTKGEHLYFKAVFWITVGLLATWAFLPQQLNTALLPLVATVALRSGMLGKIFGHA